MKTGHAMSQAEDGSAFYRRTILAALALALALAGCKADAPHPADIVIENARLLDLERGTLHEATVVVLGDRIAAVYPDKVRADIRAVRRIDAGGGVLMPGLIDTHVHLLFLEFRSRSIPDDEAVAQYVREDLPGKLGAFLAHGVTTVKTTGDYYPQILGVRDAVAAGEITGPRVFTTGPVFTVPGGHPSASLCRSDWCRARATVDATSAAAARDHVRRLAVEGVDAIKAVYSRSKTGKGETLSPEVLKAIIEEAHRQQLRVTVHTGSEQEALEALRAGADGLEHGVVHEALGSTRLAAEMRDRRVSYAPTLTVWPHEERYLLHPMGNLRQISEAGARIVLASDTHDAPWAQAAGIWTINELEWMVEAGLSRRDVLLAGTRNAAAHLGMSDQLGSVEAGKLADLVLLEGDPLEDLTVLRRPRWVIMGGKVVVDNGQPGPR